MKELFSKGHVRTPYYRLLAPNGKLAWLMTEANTTSHTCKGQKGQYVVCVHFVIGIQEPCESLVVCTDMAPAGLPVEIKKEIDDIRGKRAEAHYSYFRRARCYQELELLLHLIALR